MKNPVMALIAILTLVSQAEAGTFCGRVESQMCGNAPCNESLLLKDKDNNIQLIKPVTPLAEDTVRDLKAKLATSRSDIFACVIGSATVRRITTIDATFIKQMQPVTRVCEKRQAEEKANTLFNAIATTNGLENSPVARKNWEDENYYFFQAAFDTGLSVPTWLVRVTKSDCFVLEASYANNEG